MSPEALNSFVMKLRNSYGMSMYPKRKGQEFGEVVMFLYDQAGKDIPPGAADWIFERILDRHDRFPEKLHRVLKHQLFEYYRENPGKAPADWAFKGMCENPYCRDGWFHVLEREANTGILTERATPCAECKKLGRQMTNGLTRDSAQAKGFLLPTENVEAEYLEQCEDLRAEAFERAAVDYAPRRG